jgi:hypothetical protein
MEDAILTPLLDGEFDFLFIETKKATLPFIQGEGMHY